MNIENKPKNIINILNKFQSNLEEEIKDKELFLKALETFDDVLTRKNEFMHFTSSCFVINKEHTKVLSVFHIIYNSWGWCGGHADGDDDLLFVAKKECEEETGVREIKVLNNGLPISIENLVVASHIKKGRFVSGHLHLNFTYLFEADENLAIKINPEENKAVAWLTFEELCSKSQEKYMVLVYKKIIDKIKKNY